MIEEIENIFHNKYQIFSDWYHHKLESFGATLYTSVDMRFSGEKLVPVDTNVFPAGFNNLSELSIRNASTELRNFIERCCSKPNKILLIGEEHDRNLYYNKNLNIILNIIETAGFKAKIGYISNDLLKNGDIISTRKKFVPDLIILNNDLTSGVPKILANIKQPIIPSTKLGWFNRRKSNHFIQYNTLLKELCLVFNIPDGFFTAEFDICDNMNFKEMTNIDKLEHKVESILKKIQHNYKKLNIKQKPYLVIKSDFGTYGLGIMVINNPDEIKTLNKRNKNKLNIVKDGKINDRVLIQEGITSIDKINNKVAEPLLYFVNNNLVEFLYRTNFNRNQMDNLNSKGMEIENTIVSENYFKYQLTATILGKIASLATAVELSKL